MFLIVVPLSQRDFSHSPGVERSEHRRNRNHHGTPTPKVWSSSLPPGALRDLGLIEISLRDEDNRKPKPQRYSGPGRPGQYKVNPWSKASRIGESVVLFTEKEALNPKLNRKPIVASGRFVDNLLRDLIGNETNFDN
ncbi:hypothetical protein [Rubripirellula obstinata]|uniref:hypothetical protein n=1 Tax=Rubripirellula obstinata TaxID=406547 RepID=UPI00122C9F11|nr:hypothetical protein [Rubripirellula obstinata]